MISVCLASYNGGEYIKYQIQSILEQLNPEDELIISDDNSSDDTLNIINGFDDSRIKLYNHIPQGNNSFEKATYNFENALKVAKGDIIILSDQDDIWYKDKVRLLTNALSNADIAKHDYSTINSRGEIIKLSNYLRDDEENRNLFYLIKYLPFRGCCMAFKRILLNYTLPFPKNCLQHDSWIGLMSRLLKFRFTYIDKPLIYHRIHISNVSELKVPNSLVYKLKYRFKLLIQCLIRLMSIYKKSM